MSGQFRLEPGGSNRGSRLVIESTPAKKDPRGRTQAWQAQQRRASRALRRRPQPAIEGQTSIYDLAEEGGLTDE